MIVELSEDAAAVVAGLVAPTSDVNHEGIMTSGAVWAEIRAAFPLDLFRTWVDRHAGEGGDQGYEEAAGV